MNGKPPIYALVLHALRPWFEERGTPGAEMKKS
jgi:hypothetical protein